MDDLGGKPTIFGNPHFMGTMDSMEALTFVVVNAGPLRYFVRLLQWSTGFCSAETKPTTPQSVTWQHLRVPSEA